PASLTNVNGTLFFSAGQGSFGLFNHELWASNGSAAGTFLVKDIDPGPDSSNPTFLTNVNGVLFFKANDGTHGFELWASNGTADGTLLQDINPGGSSNPSQLTNVNGNLLFAADDGTHGNEPWILRLTSTALASSANPSVFSHAVTLTAT